MAVKKQNSTDNLIIRIAPDIKSRFGKVAESYSMSVSEYLRFLILEDIRKHEDIFPAEVSPSE